MISRLHLEQMVAPLTGSVDRNVVVVLIPVGEGVAPLTGSVDRNKPESKYDPDKSRRSPHGERG